MQKEYLTSTVVKYTINIVMNKPESLRKTVEKTNTVRVYDNGFIGVAGSIGETNYDELEKQAIENLQFKLPYPCKLPENNVKKMDNFKQILNPDNYMQSVSKIMDKISAAAPNFIFGNKATYVEVEAKYRNTKGCDMEYKGNTFSLGLSVKSKASANLFDFFYSAETTNIDENQMAKDVKVITENYDNVIDIEPGKYPVLIDTTDLFGKSLYDLLIDQYASNASMFKGKLGQKIFSDKFSMFFDRKPETAFANPFFDEEGEVAPDYERYVIKDGVLVALGGNKRQQDVYNLPVAQNSGAPYDGLPSLSLAGLTMKTENKTLAEVTKEKTIFVMVASGGDTTTDGDFATPVQYAYLVQDGKVLGKLPDFQLYGNIFDFFGKDYVTTIPKALTQTGETYFSLTKLNIQK
ncbi:MAG TPA: metallopeptidase TldD-related protein [Clostridia bacterium]|nr:metallopeptidase TldD-related protein [Clostridia bacterium]